MAGGSLRSGEVAQAEKSRVVAARLKHFKAVTHERVILLLIVDVSRWNIISAESRPQQRWLILVIIYRDSCRLTYHQRSFRGELAQSQYRSSC